MSSRQLDAKIAVIHHERQPRANQDKCILSAMARHWRAWGCEIQHVYGVDADVRADLAILHVDLSVVPKDYADFAASFPKCINAGVLDIRKRAISRNLVERDDPYEGPVIVKTDLNHGGTPEELLGLAEPIRPSLLSRIKRRLGVKNPMEMRWPAEYQVFESKAGVPSEVFDEPRLVVERLLTETRNRNYLHRRYLFLGSVEVNQLWAGSRTVNWGDHATRLVASEETPPELRARRQELRAEFGKIDYAMVDGEPHVFDVNPTPSGWIDDPIPHDAQWAQQVSQSLAPGIEEWL